MADANCLSGDPATRNQAIAIVRRFLTALEARDLDCAQSLLGRDVVMVFPGSLRFARLAELATWASGRYRTVSKRIDRMDAVGSSDGTVVMCRGTLHGTWLDGTAFDGIRFADWFLIRDGKIVHQEVWNDIAETLRR